MSTELTLDPNDWAPIRQLGHQIIDDMVDYLASVNDRPLWQPIPAEVKETYKQPLPQDPSDIFEVYSDFKKTVLPYATGNIHPSYFSWAMGTGTPLGAFADLLAGMMNTNAVMGEQSAMYIDAQVINWCKEMLNFPSTASGLLVSGASIANVTALTIARNAASDQMRSKGVGAWHGGLIAYCSKESHASVTKAIEVIGVGSSQLRMIPADDDFRINIEQLKVQIEKDKKDGLTPFCIIGNAGTVNTGAIDPLKELYEIARDEKIWFHIDGAFGALAKLVPEYEEALKYIEKADSVAFDLHKWMYMPYDVGCFLIKDAQAHKAAFGGSANYLLSHDRGLAAGPDSRSNYGMELSRSFRALKVWMSLKEHGLDKYRQLIAQNINQAHYLGDLVKATLNLELAAEVTMNIACFRYNPGTIADEELNILNKELLMQLHESGISAPSCTQIHGKYVLRACITNHRTTKAHLEELVRKVAEIGNTLITDKVQYTQATIK